MKKFLSLMLAMIMVMSLVTVGAGAAFTDAEDIQYTEAVDLMAGLGILQGPGDGTFNPKGNLSRAAAAKIIAYIALGAKKADAMTYDEVIFPDVELTSSTAPYIAWCAEQGIINGYSDGTFGRKNNVTGHAFLKMVLGALGIYGQYTGTGWQTVVTAAASKEGVKLLEGLSEDVVLSQPLTREAACQIAFNAMKVNKGNGADVEGYLMNGTLFTGDNALVNAYTYATMLKLDAAPTYVFVEGGKLLEKVHGVSVSTAGVITNNSANTETKLTTIDGVLYNVDTKLEQLGNTVKVYYKTNTKDAATKGYDVVSVVDSCTEFVVTEKTKTADLKAVLKATTETATVKVLKADGDVDGTYTVPVIDLTGDDAIDGTAFVGEKGTMNLIISGKKVVGVKEELAKSLEKIGTVKTGDEASVKVGDDTVKNGFKETDGTTTDKINAYEGIAEKDIVVLTKIGEIYNVEKAETVTGKLTKVTKDAEGNVVAVTVNGKEYAQKGTDNAIEPTELTLNFTDEFKLYLDGQGNYIVIDDTVDAPTSTTVFVVKAYTVPGKTTTDAYGQETTSKATYFVQCVNTAGEIVIFQTKVPEDKTGICTVTVEYDSTDKVDYAEFESADKTATIETDVTSKDIKVKDTAYYFADDVKFIGVKTEKYTDKDELNLAKTKATVKTGAQDVTATMYVTYKTVSGTSNKTITNVFFVGSFTTAPQTTDDIVYAIEAEDSTVVVPYADKDGKTKTGYEHVVYIDGVKTTIITNKADALTGFITLAKNGAGYTTDVNDASNLYDSVKIDNVYGKMVSADDLADVTAADAEVIDLRKDVKDADKLTSVSTKLIGKNASIVVDKSVTEKPAIVTIYVID